VKEKFQFGGRRKRKRKFVVVVVAGVEGGTGAREVKKWAGTIEVLARVLKRQ